MPKSNSHTGRWPLTVALLAAVGVSALADVPVEGQLDHGAAQAPKFEDFDRNKDGFVAKEEVPPSEELTAKFTFFDANTDGKLSHDEFAKYLASRGAPSHDKNER